MREADRPIDERVSVFDRPIAASDALPPESHRRDDIRSKPIELASLRLAATTDDVRLYAARGADDDSIWQFVFEPRGGSAMAGLRGPTFGVQGAQVGWSSSGGRTITHGIVPDSVIAVRVGDIDAVLGENGFVAVGAAQGVPVVLMTADGVRRVEFPTFPVPGNAEASIPGQPGYSGYVEYAQCGITKMTIDDLDDPNWSSTLSTFVHAGNAPDAWRVGVVLLEGPRAGELALAEIVLRRDDEGTLVGVEFRGKSNFGPHPDSPRLDAALQQWRERRGRISGVEPD